MKEFGFIEKTEMEKKKEAKSENLIEKEIREELIIDEDTVYEIDLDCIKRRKQK